MKRYSTLITVSSAIILAVISYYFFTGWFNIIPWIISALLTGYFSAGRKAVILNGAIFGYFLFLAYIIIGYKGNTDNTSILKFILFAIAFSLTGAVAGIIGALAGNFLKAKLTSKKRDEH